MTETKEKPLVIGFGFRGEEGTGMEVHTYIDCCGIREISGLSYSRGPKLAMKSFCQIYPKTSNKNSLYPTDGSKFRYAVFSQINNMKYGEKFAAYIRDNKLGDVVETTGKHMNPNSGNVLKVFVWTVDHEAVKLWMKGNLKDAKTTAKAVETEIVTPTASASSR
jgi:hypothetical protein